jgi:hypothetical protein
MDNALLTSVPLGFYSKFHWTSPELDTRGPSVLKTFATATHSYNTAGAISHPITVKLTRMFNMVYLTALDTNSSRSTVTIQSAGSITFGTIPEEFHPSHLVSGIGWAENLNDVPTLYIVQLTPGGAFLISHVVNTGSSIAPADFTAGMELNLRHFSLAYHI